MIVLAPSGSGARGGTARAWKIETFSTGNLTDSLNMVAEIVTAGHAQHTIWIRETNGHGLAYEIRWVGLALEGVGETGTVAGSEMAFIRTDTVGRLMRIYMRNATAGLVAAATIEVYNS